MQQLTITRIISAAIVFGVGLLTLIGLLVTDEMGYLSIIVTELRIRELAQLFVRISVLTIAFTVLLGVFNLLFVHAHRMRRGSTLIARVGGGVVIGSYIVALIAFVFDRAQNGSALAVLIEQILVAVEASLAGLLFFALVFGAMHTLRHRVNLARLLFVATIIFALITTINLPQLEAIAPLRDWLVRVPVSAGGRGILLGIALATVVTGVRLLFGQDRSYGD